MEETTLEALISQMDLNAPMGPLSPMGHKGTTSVPTIIKATPTHPTEDINPNVKFVIN